MRSNCIIFAWLLIRRLKRKGHRVYRMKRQSDWGPFSHHLVGIQRHGRVRTVSYKPANPRRRLLPPPLFVGRVRWGD